MPETLHTTTEHPFLTADRGFVAAQTLRVGEQVVRGDGGAGVVTAVGVTPGAAVRYNLTVQDLHTYLVGDDQWVVHNSECINSNQPYKRSNFKRTPSENSRNIIKAKYTECVYCGGSAETADHVPSLYERQLSGEYNALDGAAINQDADNPERMVGSCNSCNLSKQERSIGTGPGQWDPRSSPNNRMRGGPSVLPWNSAWGNQ